MNNYWLPTERAFFLQDIRGVKSFGIQTLHLGVQMHDKTVALQQAKIDLPSFNNQSFNA